MIYNIKRITKTNIDSRGRGSIGEPFVPGDPHNPAHACSFTPLTRPHAPTHPTKLPTGQQTRPEESFQNLLSEPRSSKRSPNARTSANDAVSAAPQTAGYSSELVTPPYASHADETITRSTTPPIEATDSERARAFWAKRTDTKTFAAVSAGTQTAGHSSELVTPPYTTHADETIKRSSTTSTSLKSSVNSRTLETKRIDAETCAATSAGTQTAGHSSELVTPPYDDTRTTGMLVRSTASPTTVVNYDIQSRANLFKGTRKPVAKDGNCFFAAVEKGDKQQVRESIVTWLRANPNHPFHTTTLSKYVTYETGEAWSEYCDRMQCAGTWAGAPELVATAQLWPTCIRVFEDSGDGLFHLEAAFGEKVEQTFTDIVYKSSHYDTLIGTSLLNPIAYGAEQLKQLGEIAERTARNELAARKEPEVEHKVPEQSVEPKVDCKTRKEPVEQQILDELAERKELKELGECKARERHTIRKFIELFKLISAEVKILEETAASTTRNELTARKELKELEERTARERHVMRKELAERKAIEKLAEPKTKPKIEPQDPASHEKPKHQHENRKARAARDLQDGLQAYRVHRALEELAACKAREESTAREMLRCRESLRMRNLTKTQAIGDLKTKIQDKDGVPTGRLRLVLAGRQLGDGCLAADCRLARWERRVVP